MECLQNEGLLWFGYLERKDQSFWPIKCQKFEVGDRLARGRLMKIWSEMVPSDMKIS